MMISSASEFNNYCHLVCPVRLLGVHVLAPVGCLLAPGGQVVLLHHLLQRPDQPGLVLPLSLQLVLRSSRKNIFSETKNIFEESNIFILNVLFLCSNIFWELKYFYCKNLPPSGMCTDCRPWTASPSSTSASDAS